MLLESLSSPQPTSIQPLKSSGVFHAIYIISYTQEDLAAWLASNGLRREHSYTELVLRVSGNHIENIKTDNEAAILSWIIANTTIPVPAVVAFNSTRDNILKEEFILQTCEPGKCLADVFQNLTPHQLDDIIDQLIDMLVQLHTYPWDHIGGLQISSSGAIIPGSIIEETFWHNADIAQFFDSTESHSTLNISGPFPSYTAYITAHIEKYIHAIEVHPSLDFMREIIPLLRGFLADVATSAEKLDDAVLRLCHKDLHFGNILIDPQTARITSILDWEFSGVVPHTRWNPSRAFLWNGQDSDASLAEKRTLVGQFEKRAEERGYGYLVEDAKFKSREQEAMQNVQGLLRAIVEVCPRGVMGEMVGRWKQRMLDEIAVVGRGVNGVI